MLFVVISTPCARCYITRSSALPATLSSGGCRVWHMRAPHGIAPGDVTIHTRIHLLHTYTHVLHTHTHATYTHTASQNALRAGAPPPSPLLLLWHGVRVACCSYWPSIHSHTHTKTHTHTYTHTYTHTKTHTHIHTSKDTHSALHSPLCVQSVAL